MRALRIIFICVILLFNCQSWSAISQNLNTQTNESKSNLKKIGREILDGRKIATIDESIIYQLIDSILTRDTKNREFYFKVFNEMDHQAKGEIVVAMDWKIKDFCFKYPNEFFNISDSDILVYSRRIGELFRTEEENPIEAAKEYLNEIKKRTNQEYFNKENTFSIELVKKANGER